MSDFTLPNGMRTDSKNIHHFAKDLSKNVKDIEYRIACIRDFVREHQDQVLSIDQLAKAAQYTSGPSATHTVKKLLREGRLTRRKVKDGKPGVKYAYSWHDKRDPVRANGPVIIKTPGVAKTDNTFLKLFDEKAWRFITDQKLGEIDQLLKFRDWVMNEGEIE